MKFKAESNYFGNITLSEGFIRSDMAGLSETELKIYLMVLMLAQSKTQMDIPELSGILSISADEAILSLKSLEKKELLRLSSTAVTVKAREAENTAKPLTFREYTPEEIAAMDDKDINKLVRCAEKTYGKLLSYGEINTLISLYKFVEIPCEVLMILIEYTGALGRKTMAYLKTSAMDWHERGIDTPKKAHAHITYLEQLKDYYARMKEVLGIYGREFTKKEREFLDKWQELQFTPEQIKEAYEKTIDATGKISFAYMNKILTSDEKTERPAAVQKTVKKVKPTGFNNFKSRTRDYDAIKARAREKVKKQAEKLQG